MAEQRVYPAVPVTYGRRSVPFISASSCEASLVVSFICTIPKSAEAVQALLSRAGIVVESHPADRRRIEAIVAGPQSRAAEARMARPHHLWRRPNGSRHCRRSAFTLRRIDACGLAMLQARFMAEGVDGLTRRARQTRSHRCPPPSCSGGDEPDDRDLTGRSNPLDWSDAGRSGRRSLRSVQRILEAHRLAPHRPASSS